MKSTASTPSYIPTPPYKMSREKKLPSNWQQKVFTATERKNVTNDEMQLIKMNNEVPITDNSKKLLAMISNVQTSSGGTEAILDASSMPIRAEAEVSLVNSICILYINLAPCILVYI